MLAIILAGVELETLDIIDMNTTPNITNARQLYQYALFLILACVD